MFGHFLPIWAVILIAFGCVYPLENLMGSPMSFKLAARSSDPRKSHPVLFETAIISATVGLMCPAMSFLAAWMYSPCYEGFHLLHLVANWLRRVCFNFPFAWLSQLFFIQPFVRKCFKHLFVSRRKTA